MIDLSKYSEKEVVVAIKVVEEILDVEDFTVNVRVATPDDTERMYDDSFEGQQVYSLIDRQGGNLGDINQDVFSNLSSIIARTDIYHNDYFYKAYDERVDRNEEIPQDDFDRKVLIFLQSDYAEGLLSAIDVETYQKYKDIEIDGLNLNPGEVEKYVKDGRFDEVGYLCDKSIAVKIMDTQEAYPMVEYDNSIYVAAHGDWYDNAQQMLDELKTGENSFCNSYYTYGTLVETELYQVKDDMNDLGLYDDKDNWSFYLSEYELEYIGLGEEKDKFKEEFEDIRILSENDVSDEYMEHHLEAIVANAKNRVVADNVNVGVSKSECDKEME